MAKNRLTRYNLIKAYRRAYEIRDILYGRRMRPLGRNPRYVWGKTIVGFSHFGGPFLLAAAHRVADAEDIASWMEEAGWRGEEKFYDEALDDRVRQAWVDELIAAVKRKPRGHKPKPRDPLVDIGVQAVRDGICPECGEDFVHPDDGPDCHDWREVKVFPGHVPWVHQERGQ